MIQQGLVLTVLGMGIVFAFLTLLVFVMNLIAIVARKYFPEKEVPEPKKARGGNDAEVAAAIAAATAYARS